MVSWASVFIVCPYRRLFPATDLHTTPTLPFSLFVGVLVINLVQPGLPVTNDKFTHEVRNRKAEVGVHRSAQVVEVEELARQAIALSKAPPFAC